VILKEYITLFFNGNNTAFARHIGKERQTVQRWLKHGNYYVNDGFVHSRSAGIPDLDCYYLDTETTGSGEDDEVVQLAIVNSRGASVFDSYIKPSKPIAPEATAISGISDETVKDAPTWSEVHKQINDLLAGQNVYIYNADFDVRIMAQTASKHGLSLPAFNAECLMNTYSLLYAEYNPRTGSYDRRQKLTNAAMQQGVNISDLTAHNALDDCEITRRLHVKLLAGSVNKCVVHREQSPK